jgi:hypothetical protein
MYGSMISLGIAAAVGSLTLAICDPAPQQTKLPDPGRNYAEWRSQLRQSRAAVIPAVYTTYEVECNDGVLLPNPSAECQASE